MRDLNSVENASPTGRSRPAKFYLSFDFELGWGVIANGRWKIRQHGGVYTRLRSVLPQVLELLESREIRGDWATVGAMASKPTSNELEHLPLSYAELVRSFLREAESQTLDGQDLVDLVASTRHQRIVSHGFSHVVLDRTDLSDEALQYELTRNAEILSRWNGNNSTVVFPENRVPAFSRLVGTDVELARIAPLYADNPICRLLQKTCSPPESMAIEHAHCIRSRTGSMLFKPRSLRRVDRHLFDIQRKSVVRRLASGVDQCLWVHPFNFAEYPDLTEHLTNLLDEVYRLRSAGIVESCSLD